MSDDDVHWFDTLDGNGWDKAEVPSNSSKAQNNKLRNKGVPEQTIRILDFRWQNPSFSEDESDKMYRELYGWIDGNLFEIPTNFPNYQETVEFYVRKSDKSFEDWDSTRSAPVLYPEKFDEFGLDPFK